MNRIADIAMFMIIGAMLVVVFVTGAPTTQKIVPAGLSAWLKSLVIISGSQPPSAL